jgi:hypothetical protein
MNYIYTLQYHVSDKTLAYNVEPSVFRVPADTTQVKHVTRTRMCVQIRKQFQRFKHLVVDLPFTDACIRTDDVTAFSNTTPFHQSSFGTT